MSEPRTWTLPEEPPVGTVVGPLEDGSKPLRWKRFPPFGSWFSISSVGEQVGLAQTWHDVLGATRSGLRDYPDASKGDPPQCVAHGAVACAVCSLNPSSCAGDSPECATFSDTGMHWDTCPNRVRGVQPDGGWLMGNGRVVGPSPVADPDGRQSELDRLRAEVQRLTDEAEDVAERNEAALEGLREDCRTLTHKLLAAEREALEWQRKWRDLGATESTAAHNGAAFTLRTLLQSEQPATLSVHRDETWGGFELRIQRDGEQDYAMALLQPRDAINLASALIQPEAAPAGGSAATP